MNRRTKNNAKRDTGTRTLTAIEGIDINNQPIVIRDQTIKGVYAINAHPTVLHEGKKYAFKIGSGGLTQQSNIYKRLYSYGTVYPNGHWQTVFLLTHSEVNTRNLENQLHAYFNNNRYQTQFLGRTRHEWFVLTLASLRKGFKEIYKRNKPIMPDLQYIQSNVSDAEMKTNEQLIKSEKRQFA